MIDEKFKAVKKVLKRKKEKVIIDLIIKNYDKTNFYMALVFNYRIEKFKVLFVPIDALEIKKVEEYLCYQFIFLSTVNYILETINAAKEKYQNDNFRNKISPTLDAYYIEINTHVGGEDFKFKTNQIIPKEWDFFFEAIIILFEHAPNLVSELCNKILALFNNVIGHVKYDYSFDIDSECENLGVFSKEEMENGEELFKKGKLQYLEKIQDKFYAVIDNNIIILECDLPKKILNIYSNNKKIDRKYFYSVILALKQEIDKKFEKILMKIDNEEKINYLCYGVNEEGLLVIYNNEKKIIPLEDIWSIKVLECTIDFEKKLEILLENKFNKKEMEKIKKEIYEEKI